MIVSAALALVLPASFAGPAAAAPSSGFNDWSCRPSAEHPRPVVLLHGFFGSHERGWSYVAPRLAGAGYCVFALNYGGRTYGLPVYGNAPLQQSAAEITAFVDRVRSTTGSSQVDLLGHSEGGFLSLYVTKVLGYAPKIGTVVAMAPPTHGVSIAGLAPLGLQLGLTPAVARLLQLIGCGPCTDLVPGGGAVRQLNDGPVAAVPGPAYTVIATRYDVLVSPEQAFIPEPGVDNILVQAVCPFDPVGHIGLALDAGVVDMITNALDPSTAVPVRCSAGPPV
jgi:pimeloyl-ACP methyl ester carboxylesterase